LTGADDDEMLWMEDAHMTAISLLYDIAIFSYSTVARKWYAFNERARGSYICLLSSTNHTDVLHGTSAHERPFSALKVLTKSNYI